jgi:hypothetical protein
LPHASKSSIEGTFLLKREQMLCFKDTRTWFAFLSIALLLQGCGLEVFSQPSLLVRIKDPNALAQASQNFNVRLKATNDHTKNLPLTDCDLTQAVGCKLTLRTETAGEREIWIEALDADNTVLARSYNKAEFVRGGAEIEAILEKPCVVSSDCEDEEACNGSESCDMERCQAGQGLAAGDECVLSDGPGHCDEGACVAASCGDGFLCDGEDCTSGPGGAAEECDAAADTEECDSDCSAVECGDGHLNFSAGEKCDDGNQNNEDACVACKHAECGDGYVCADGDGYSCAESEDLNGEEACDGDGAGNGGETETCDEDCTPAVCGDGGEPNSTAGETCEDQNQNNNDTCPDGDGGTCQFAVCGDGFVQTNVEDCDGDGAGNGGETATCTSDCTFVSMCGNSVLDGDEECDDG